MRLQTRLQRLEHRAGADRVREDTEVVEIRLPDDGRGGLPPGRYPCPGSNAVLIIYEPTAAPPLGEAQPRSRHQNPLDSLDGYPRERRRLSTPSLHPRQSRSIRFPSTDLTAQPPGGSSCSSQRRQMVPARTPRSSSSEISRDSSIPSQHSWQMTNSRTIGTPRRSASDQTSLGSLDRQTVNGGSTGLRHSSQIRTGMMHLQKSGINAVTSDEPTNVVDLHP